MIASRQLPIMTRCPICKSINTMDVSTSEESEFSAAYCEECTTSFTSEGFSGDEWSGIFSYSPLDKEQKELLN